MKEELQEFEREPLESGIKNSKKEIEEIKKSELELKETETKEIAEILI